ncbi:hypothetical protein [Methanobrevibacter sp.]|uniref:hypothetical protein n=1 Tax=Methanobrevibacter sp. TaxID=66852 RepID=UPI003890C9C0
MKFRNTNNPDEIIEFLTFNYDGRGSSLYIYSDSTTVHKMTLEETEDAIMGKKTGELPLYELICEYQVLK